MDKLRILLFPFAAALEIVAFFVCFILAFVTCGALERPLLRVIKVVKVYFPDACWYFHGWRK
jgi:hypothetical protein